MDSFQGYYLQGTANKTILLSDIAVFDYTLKCELQTTLCYRMGLVILVDICAGIGHGISKKKPRGERPAGIKSKREKGQRITLEHSAAYGAALRSPEPPGPAWPVREQVSAPASVQWRHER